MKLNTSSQNEADHSKHNSIAKPDRVSRLTGWTFTYIGAICSIILFLFYVTIGDTTPLGSAITVFPPVLWLIPLIVLFLPAIFTRSRYAIGLAVFCLLLVLFSANEWRHIFLRPDPSIRNKQGLRLITWNIAGRTEWPQILGELQVWQPDIVFLQETPDGDASLSTSTLTGYWSGFSWLDQGDCGILCRYTLDAKPTSKIGSWDKPTIAVTTSTISETPHRILLCNVRMMMPVNATSPGRIPSEADYRMRVDQYTELAKLIRHLKGECDIDSVILAGDFNIRGGSKSLKPLREIGLRDVWPKSGRGWGATILADFPVARIDQIWISQNQNGRQTQTAVGDLSDHRMVISELSAEARSARD